MSCVELVRGRRGKTIFVGRAGDIEWVCAGEGITSQKEEMGIGEENEDFFVCMQCMKLL